MRTEREGCKDTWTEGVYRHVDREGGYTDMWTEREGYTDMWTERGVYRHVDREGGGIQTCGQTGREGGGIQTCGLTEGEGTQTYGER